METQKTKTEMETALMNAEKRLRRAKKALARKVAGSNNWEEGKEKLAKAEKKAEVARAALAQKDKED